MKFTINSNELAKMLVSASRVINTRNTLPILDNFMISAHEGFSVTASDMENTIIVSGFADVSEAGETCTPARVLTELVRGIDDKPLTFDIDKQAQITWEGGNFTLPVFDVNDYPINVNEADNRITLSGEVLIDALAKTFYAAGDDPLRPVMNGIFLDLENGHFVATDAHKLAMYGITPVSGCSLIISKKTAHLLRNLLSPTPVDVEYGQKSVIFRFGGYVLTSRLVEGSFPNYKSVIPTNPHKLEINRTAFLSVIKRVGVCSSDANLVRLKITSDRVLVSAQDFEHGISAQEEISCEYLGEDMEIGFKGALLSEVLSNLDSDRVQVALRSKDKPAIFTPMNEQDVLALLMPMMIE